MVRLSVPESVLEELRAAGYTPGLERPPTSDPEKPTAPKLVVRGPGKLSPELRRRVADNTPELKLALLLTEPPPWLGRLFDLYWSGHETPVKRSGPSGGAEVYMVSVSIKNIAAAVAAEIGMPVLEWERILPEVEEALGSWEGAV